jgi:hypothetical protein
VLDVIADDALTISEMLPLMDARPRTPECDWGIVYPEYVRSVVLRMVADGQLNREPEVFQKTKTRYR